VPLGRTPRFKARADLRGAAIPADESMSMSSASATHTPNEPDNPLVELVDFKWLMAGEGHRIDLDRLQQDRSYARGCLSLAAGSSCGALRDAARRVRCRLEADSPLR
jgi:hypothetical protein